ncbi:7407_t:CDS:2, partial [Scutellospora calospora]
SQGGLDVSTLPDLIDTCLLHIWIKLLTENNLWAKIKRPIIERSIYNKRSIEVKAKIEDNEEVLSNITNWSQLINESWKNSWKWMSDSGKCPNCPNIIQSPEHFTLNCPISKKIWKIALDLVAPSAKLKIPENLNDMFSDYYTGNIYLRNWININVIYEIWFWYMQVKWGNPMFDPALESVIKYKLKKAIKALSYDSKGDVEGKFVTHPFPA